MTMVCSHCHRTGVVWVGDLCNDPHTKCPHCGGVNCQEAEPAEDADECMAISIRARGKVK